MGIMELAKHKELIYIFKREKEENKVFFFF